MNSKSIGITFIVDNKKIDLQVPNQVTFNRLKDLLKESTERLQILLPEQFDFKVVNKPLNIAEDSLISDYPLSNGDQIRVLKTI